MAVTSRFLGGAIRIARKFQNLPPAKTTIDGQFGAGAKAGIFGREEKSGTGDVVGFAQTLECHPIGSSRRMLGIFPKEAGHFGLYDPWANGVSADVRPQIHGDALGEHHRPGLA